MCFECTGPITLDRSGYCIRVERVADPLTTPTDLDAPDALTEAYKRGEWDIIGLHGTVVRCGEEVCEYTLYGIPEIDRASCAYENAGALSSLESVLQKEFSAILQTQRADYDIAAEAADTP